MATVFSLVTTFLSTDKPEDYCTNTVWHTIDADFPNPGVGYQSHADEIRDLFAGRNPTYPQGGHFYLGRNIRVIVYDLADAKPRPERAVSTYTPSTPDAVGDYGPHQVACVLSYYGTRNLPRQRGRIYIGPVKRDDQAVSIQSSFSDAILQLGHGLFDTGGENVAHIVHSEVSGLDTVVQNYWVDDSWDVVRRRKLGAGGRKTLAP
jgi:hypothetical protein